MERAELLANSFEDCPYGCTNGYLLDRLLRKRVPCPYCSKKKKELSDKGLALTVEGNVELLSTILGVQNEYMKAVFSYDLVVPDGERLYLEKESLVRQEEVANDVYYGLTIGKLPERSYCFGLGNKGRVDRFIYPMLAKAYLSGLTVAKFVSCTDYNRMLVNMSPDLDMMYGSDFLAMFICDGSSKADIAAAKGLMQTRALRGKPTIFVTTWSIEACSILLGYWSDTSNFLATGVFVEYKVSGKNKHSHYINQLTGVENSTMYAGEVEEEDEKKVENKKEEKIERVSVSMADLLGS